jgi:hypothetical protein
MTFRKMERRTGSDDGDGWNSGGWPYASARPSAVQFASGAMQRNPPNFFTTILDSADP